MKLTQQQRYLIVDIIDRKLIPIFEDNLTRAAILGKILLDIEDDIESTADWSSYEQDEVNESDISISLERVLYNIITKD